MHTTRCWMTGVEIQRNDAWVLDRERATAIRQDLAGRLAVLDQLLEQLGPVAGSGARAIQIGGKPFFRRVVTNFVAKGYASMFGDDALFLRQMEDAERSLQRRKELAMRHPWIGARVKTLTDEEWSAMRSRTQVAIAGMNHRDVLEMRRLGLDVALAVAGPGEDAPSLESWLARTPALQVLQALAPPDKTRDACLASLHIRLATYDQRTARREALVDQLDSTGALGAEPQLELRWVDEPEPAPVAASEPAVPAAQDLAGSGAASVPAMATALQAAGSEPLQMATDAAAAEVAS